MWMQFNVLPWTSLGADAVYRHAQNARISIAERQTCHHQSNVGQGAQAKIVRIIVESVILTCLKICSTSSTTHTNA